LISSIAALLGAVLASPPAAAEPLRYDNPTLHYSLTAPEGWVRMPDEVIGSRGHPDGEPNDIPPVAAFQEPHDSWFHVPALVISHFPEPGRRPRDIFEELSRDYGGQSGKAVVHDDKRGVVLVAERTVSEEGREIQRVAVFKPAKAALLHLDFYLPVGDRPPYLDPTILQVLDSVRFEPGFEMRDLAPGESVPLSEDLRRVLREKPHLAVLAVLGLLGLLGGIVASRRRPKR
jgi:hypothetical protein